MKKVITILLCILPLLVFSQTAENTLNNDSSWQEAAAVDWIANLYEMGLEMTDDSLVVGKEFQKVLTDETYRSSIYPEAYNWQVALQLLKANDLKKAFWHMINLYPENETNKELVVKSILAYDQLLKMDEVLIATFYTYSFMDPEVGIIKDGKPEITRPDILEAKLRTVKEIVRYIKYYRDQKK